MAAAQARKERTTGKVNGKKEGHFQNPHKSRKRMVADQKKPKANIQT